METILKKYTTIPQHLYVDRNADTQLKRIIEEMQRPGYVLVARQMGKTNLLFNAKRTLENSDRLFAYIDLSNLYVNERDCYRNIINNIIEPNLAIFQSIEHEIEEIRIKNLPPHNEYSRCLIKLLNSLSGDLVIILDEIDALKSVSYSDNIFAQIRSNYFSRTNYPLLEKLTYVLSGVIEPTELIKDRNKSPFNIGDKIYLDDFTKVEHDVFITKSKLKINEYLSNEIYNWTNGNPRLTFDICAEIEDYINENGSATIDILKEIITQKYLTTYDIAPIDHIRELVKSNKNIRNAVSKIHRKKSSDIDDETKRKLYLYGIINSKFNDETVIKNKIVELTLSPEWIKSIDKENSYVYGLAKYSDKQYSAAIDILLEVLTESQNSSEIDGCNYFLGKAYLKLRDFENATLYFSHEYKDNTYKSDSLAFLGVCRMGVGDIEGGISILEDATKDVTNTNAYQNALLNLAVHISDEDKALELYEKLYDSTLACDDSNNEDLEELRTLSLFSQAQIFEKKADRVNAIKKLELALTTSRISDSVALIRKKYLLQLDKDEKLKTDLVNIIVDNKLIFETNNLYTITFSEEKIYYYLSFVFDRANIAQFVKLFDYVKKTLITNLEAAHILYNMSFYSTNRLDILDYIIENYQDADDILLYQIYSSKLTFFLKQEVQFFEIFESYYSFFIKQDNFKIEDIYLFANAIKFYSDARKITEAINLCKDIEYRVNLSTDVNINNEAVVIFFWMTHLYFGLRDRKNSVKYADITLDLIKAASGKKMSVVDEKGLSVISDQVNQIKTSSIIVVPIVNKKKYGRNDWVKVKYLDGTEVEKKYKALEADILSDRCEII